MAVKENPRNAIVERERRKMSKIDSKLKVESLVLHGGQEADTATGSRAVPIYQTT